MDTQQTNSRQWAGRFSKPIIRNRYAIGDIHGCSKTLRAMVEDVLRLGPDDILYLLGDYIDRGPDSKGVLDYLMLLQDDGYDIRPLMGNHENMLIKSISRVDAKFRWLSNGGKQTLNSFNVKQPGDIPQKYLDFIASLPKIIALDDYVLVHAGLHFGVPDPITDTPDFFLLWERDNKVIPELIEGRTLVVGHTMKDLDQIQQSLATQCITLDNGCFDKGHIGFGNLVALNLDTRELLVVENCE